MKKKELLKKATAFALAGAMTLSLAACGNEEGNSQNSEGTESVPTTSGQEQSDAPEASDQQDSALEMEDTTINIRIMNEYRNLDKVVDKYVEMTKDDPVMSKIHLNFTWVPGGEYRDKLNTAMIGQEDYDLMFCGSWHGLSTYIQEGDFADLSSYFNNDAFPGLKTAFPADFVEAMTSYIRQEDGSYQKGIYGINLASYYEDSRGFVYREDLRKKYNCDPITDEDSLFAFAKTVAENEEDMIGVSLWNFFRLDSPWYSAKHDNVYTQDNVNILGDQTWIWVGLSEDGKTVLNAVVPGDSEEEFAKMPEGYQYDFITEYTVERTKWNPYLNPSRGTTDTVEKYAAISYGTLSGYESAVKDGQEKIPGSEYGFYVIDDAQRNQEPGAVICDMATNNWLVVPEWSEKVDAVMYFLDWMFGSQEAHDLFQYGIEGEDWEAIGTDGYRKLDIAEKDAYAMPDYSLTLNPTYLRVSEYVANDAEIKGRFDYMYDSSTYVLSPLAGFTFDPSAVETQVANVSALSNELQLTISMYDADEAVEKINNWHTEATKVGLEEIRAELISQIQAFLDAKNAN
ncbi:MAG: extracellular solute-binding protein [Lachnospiraceae bacterium]|nr:extracellular solute-binding protein [uncultured Acetatifactor sp.]MCI8286493.1 extracellular solute-binding protein [Lachnospiraceae bacterium]